jgi:hypothetical protein
MGRPNLGKEVLDEGGPLMWGSVRGPKLLVNVNETVVTDFATSPKTGDGAGGRYRPIVAKNGLKGGVHRFAFKLLKPGRVLLGVCSDGIQAHFSEKEGKSLHQLANAWTICLNANCSGNMGKWHNGKRTPSNLDGVPVGGLLEVELDCNENKLTFLVNGKSTATSSCPLPADTVFYPCAAFGGDDMKGCSIGIQAGAEEVLSDWRAFTCFFFDSFEGVRGATI